MTFGFSKIRRTSMKLNNKVVRGIVLIAGIVLLILPSLMMSAIYASIDLELAISATLISVLTAVWLPRLKWVWRTAICDAWRLPQGAGRLDEHAMTY